MIAAIGWNRNQRVRQEELRALLYTSQGPPGSAFICSGFRGDLEEGLNWGPTIEPCPDGYAFFGQDDPPGGLTPESPARYVGVTASCCRLPYPDILTDHHVYNVMEECPEGYVATGGGVAERCGSFCTMRCTKINTAKYKLGPERSALYWTRKWSAVAWGGGSALKIDWEDIPVAIRNAVGRTSAMRSDVDGCIGFPFGSLLVRKTRKSCDGFFYRQLLFLDGKPVPTYPECEELDDPRAEYPRCVKPSAGSADAENPSRPR